MDGNNLVGSIPPEIAYLDSLVELDLSANVLTSTVPTELFLLNNLGSLSISSNQLSGEVRIYIYIYIFRISGSAETKKKHRCSSNNFSSRHDFSIVRADEGTNRNRTIV